MITLTASQARIPTAAFNRVAYKGERIRVKHRSGETVVLISEEDLALLEAIEDRLAREAATKALSDMKAKGEPAIPWDDVKKELGL